jgi:hypothetical protein
MSTLIKKGAVLKVGKTIDAEDQEGIYANYW